MLHRVCLLLIMGAFLLCAVGSSNAQQHQGYWFKRANTPTPRQEMPVVEYQGKIYLMGGITESQQPTAIVEIFDPASNTWETGTALPEPLHHFGLAVVNDKFYIFGGYNEISQTMMPLSTVYEYDPVQDTWTEKAPMSVARGELAAITFEGKIYVMGGGDLPSYGLDLNEVYDPDTDTWSNLAPMPTGRNHLDLVVIDSLIYAVGGRVGYFNYGVLEAYSPASDTWYVLPDMPTPRGGLSAAAVGDKFYAMGGEVMGPVPDIHGEIEEFDTQTRTWRRVADMLTPRHGIGSAAIGDTVFVISGAPNALYGVTAANEGFVMGTCVDGDYDGYGDSGLPSNTCPADNCPGSPNPEQTDSDGDGNGDACDICPGYDDMADFDGDTVPDSCDNCPEDANPDQADADQDDIGDICDYICGDANGDESINIGDAVFIVNLVFHGGDLPDPYQAGDTNCDGSVNIGDAVYLINYVFRENSPEPCAECP